MEGYYHNLLVIEDDVWPPDVVGGNMEHIDTTVFVGVPSHFVIVPELLHPQICGHDLISKVLELKDNSIFRQNTNQKLLYYTANIFVVISTMIRCGKFPSSTSKLVFKHILVYYGWLYFD